MSSKKLLTAAAVFTLFMTGAAAARGGGAASGMGVSGHGAVAGRGGIGFVGRGFPHSQTGSIGFGRVVNLGDRAAGFSRQSAQLGAGRFLTQRAETRNGDVRGIQERHPGLHWLNPDLRNVSNGGPSGTGDQEPVPFVDAADARHSCAGPGVISPPASNDDLPVVIYGSAAPCSDQTASGPGIYYMQ